MKFNQYLMFDWETDFLRANPANKITRSKSAKETLEKGGECVQINSKDTRTMTLTSFWGFL